MRILLAYGSALSRIDDMKLFGGVSGGRTGKAIFESCWEAEHELTTVLTNPWTLPDKPVRTMRTKLFRTWQGYRDLLYDQCEDWKPDIVICAVAVSNYTPQYIHLRGKDPHDAEFHQASVSGKIDSRLHTELLLEMVKTPNIIGGVRDRIGRDAVLVGFKLTSHGDARSLVEDYAQDVLEEAQCDIVIANDLKLGLGRKFFVTPTGWWEGKTADIVPVAQRLHEAKQSGFYRSVVRNEVEPKHKDIEVNTEGVSEAYQTGLDLWDLLGDQMKPHGCLAVRIKGGGFVTTTRGKEGQHTGVRYTPKVSGTGCVTAVWDVNHDKRTVLVGRHEFSQEKATLNAPLIDRMFDKYPAVQTIVHLHRHMAFSKWSHGRVPYVPPGTVAEVALAGLACEGVLDIDAHGSLVGFQTTDLDEIVAFVEDEENWA